MTDKEIQKLSRKQLLKIMLNQSMRIDELESELESVKKELTGFKNDIKFTAQSKYLVEQALSIAKRSVDDFFKEKNEISDGKTE